jgi:hypothetical protein
VFERIEQLVEEAPDDVAALAHLLDRVQAKLTAALSAELVSGEWASDGDLSPSAWLRRTAGLSRRDAARLTKTAARLSELPAVASAHAEGALSSAQVACITAIATPARLPLLAQTEATWLPSFLPLHVDRLTIACRHLAAAIDDQLEVAPAERPNEVWLSSTLDGQSVLNGSLDAYSGEVVASAIRVASSYPDCDVTRVTTDGPGDLDNLVLLCSTHHHQIHQPGWHDKLLPDGTYEVTTPTGTTLTSRPPPPAVLVTDSSNRPTNP